MIQPYARYPAKTKVIPNNRIVLRLEYVLQKNESVAPHEQATHPTTIRIMYDKNKISGSIKHKLIVNQAFIILKFNSYTYI